MQIPKKKCILVSFGIDRQKRDTLQSRCVSGLLQTNLKTLHYFVLFDRTNQLIKQNNFDYCH